MTDNSNANSFWAERAYWLSKCAAASERNRSDQTGTQVPEVAKFHGFDYGISYETQINRNLHSTVSERVRAAPRAVLSAQQAIEIYSQRPVSGTGGWRTLIVAERFGVSPKTVRDIWNRRSWAPETRHLWAPGEFAAAPRPRRPSASPMKILSDVGINNTPSSPCKGSDASASGTQVIVGAMVHEADSLVGASASDSDSSESASIGRGDHARGQSQAVSKHDADGNQISVGGRTDGGGDGRGCDRDITTAERKAEQSLPSARAVPGQSSTQIGLQRDAHGGAIRSTLADDTCPTAPSPRKVRGIAADGNCPVPPPPPRQTPPPPALASLPRTRATEATSSAAAAAAGTLPRVAWPIAAAREAACWAPAAPANAAALAATAAADVVPRGVFPPAVAASVSGPGGPAADDPFHYDWPHW